MALLIPLVVLVGLLGLINLAVQFGVLRRLREHDAHLATLVTVDADPMLPAGEPVGEFATTTTRGSAVSTALLAEGTLVGFFDPECETCHEHLPEFATQARRIGREHALAVVRAHDGNQDEREMVAQLAPVADVVVERRRGPVARAFHVKAIPSFCHIGAGGVVRNPGYAPAPAPTGAL